MLEGFTLDINHVITLCGFIGAGISFLLMLKANKRHQNAQAAKIEAEAKLVAAQAEVLQEQSRRKQAEWEVNIRQSVPRYTDFVLSYERQHKEVRNLINTTEIDRFVQFKAINGREMPKYTSAFHQIREGGQDFWEFEHVPLDKHYENLFTQILTGEPARIVTTQLPPCLLKEIYVGEGITASLLFYVTSFVLDESAGVVVHVYISLATHSPELISDITVTRCTLMVNRLRAFAAIFDEGAAREIMADGASVYSELPPPET